MPNLDDLVDVEEVDGRRVVPSQAPNISDLKDVEPERPSIISKGIHQLTKWSPIEQLQMSLYLDKKFKGEKDFKDTELNPPYSPRVQQAITEYETNVERQGFGRVIRDPMLAGIAVGLVAAPLETAAMVGAFALKDKFINFRRYVEHQFPTASPESKDMAEIADFAVFGGLIAKGEQKAGDMIAGRLRELKLPSSFNLTPDHLKILRDHPDVQPHSVDVLNTLGIDAQKADAALNGGLSINVPAEKMIDLAQKPYWDKIRPVMQIPEEPTQSVLDRTIQNMNRRFSQSFRDVMSWTKRAIINKGNSYLPVINRFGWENYASVEKALHFNQRELIGFDNQKSEVFDKTFSQVESHFNQYPDDHLRNFNLIRGNPESPGAQQIKADAIKKLPSELRDPNLMTGITEVSDYNYNRALNLGIDLNYFEDYFFGSYKDSKKVGKFLDYWRSTESYAKEKKLPTPADAAEFGLELKDLNPITNLRQEMQLIGHRGGMLKLRREIFGEEPLPAEKVARIAKEKSVSILGEVRKRGGIDPEKVSKDYNISEDFKQAGIFGVLKKGGAGLDEMAQTLQGDGLLQVPEGKTPGDYLLEVLKNKDLRTVKDTYAEDYKAAQEGKPSDEPDYDPEFDPTKLGARAPGDPQAHNYAVLRSKATPYQLVNWDKINEPVFKDSLFDPDYAKFVNNILSHNKLNDAFLLKGLRGTAKAAQSIKFFGSIYHLGSEALAGISDEAGAAANLKGTANVLKAFKPIDRGTPEYEEYIGLGLGHEQSIESISSKAYRDVLEKISLGKFREFPEKLRNLYGKTKWIPASPEMIRWQFEEYIPAMKFNAWLQKVASKEEAFGRPLTDGEKIKIGLENQNIYGEMNEKLFGRSGTVTSFLRIIFSAPGYGEGNFRTVFGATGEVMDAAGNLVKGKVPQSQMRYAQFILNTLLNVYVMSQIGTRLHTGKWQDPPKTPDDLRDSFKIKTNQLDGNGDIVYYDMMRYSSDYWSIFGNALTGRPGKIIPDLGKRLTGAQSAVFKATVDLADISTGKMVYDWQGKPVFQKTDDFVTQLSKLIAHEGIGAKPISGSKFEQATKKGIKPLEAITLSAAGITATTSEKVKMLKDARQDYFSLEQSKKQKQLDIDKQYRENPDGAMAEIDKFNRVQISKLKKLMGKIGVNEFDEQTIVKNFLINSVGGERVGEGTPAAVEGLFQKQAKRSKRERVVDLDQIDQMLQEQGIQ